MPPPFLEAWYPGEEGGRRRSPTFFPANTILLGRLPVTFYQSVVQLPPFGNYSMSGRTYRYFTEPPLYPFGFGLSFSSFNYSDAESKPGTGRRGGHRHSLRSRGRTPVPYQATKLWQLYLAHPGVEGAPMRAPLAGFQRIHLDAAASQNRRFHLARP